MPTERFEGQLAAGATEGNLMKDSIFRQLPFPASVAVYAVCDGAAVQGTFKLSLNLGNSIIIPDAAVPTFTATLGPNRNDHLLGGDVAVALDMVQLKLVNGDANPVNYRIVVDIKRIQLR